MTLRRRQTLAAAALGLPWVLFLYGGGLSRDRVLAARDVLVLHLPLRADLARLAAGFRIPWWNPWLNGGQPLLSNPHYAAFYPPTWLALAVEPHYALGLGLVFHGAVAFAGAWLLARRLGGGTAAAALAAIGWSGCGAFMSLVHLYNVFCAAAWLPWALAFAVAAFDAPAGRPRRWLAPAAGCGAALALQLLAGEPVTAAATAAMVAVFAVVRGRRGERPGRRAVLARLAAVALASLLLAAVQLLPTAHRLYGSSRAAGLEADDAMFWSTRPLRLVEAVLPRAFGEATAYAAGRYYGDPLHDRSTGFVRAIHPGLPLLVVGLAALAAGGVRRRGAWAAIAAAALLLALGRHAPVLPWLRGWVPFLGGLRFPERFLVPAVAAVVFAGALGWERLAAAAAEPADEGRRRRLAVVALGVAAAVTVASAALAAALWLAPETVQRLMADGSPARLSPAGLERGLAYLRRAALLQVGLATAVTGLIAAAWRAARPAAGRASGRWLPAAAVLLLALDLGYHGAGLIYWLPAAELETPPPAARAVPPGSRLFADDALVSASERLRPGREPVLAPVRAQLARLDPYSANLWGVPYVLNGDFDLMATRWERHAARALMAEWPDAGTVLPLLGAWNTGALVLRRPLGAAPGAEQGEPTEGARVLANPHLLPRLRPVPRVRFHAGAEAALAAVRAQGFRVERVDHWIGAAPPDVPSGAAPPPRRWQAREAGGDLVLRYAAARPLFLVAAVTYDEGWRAELDGRPLAVHPTGLGQLGVVLPAGEGELVLAYRDPWVVAGAAVTGTFLVLLATAAALAAARRRRAAAG